ncbi:hypothetical protein M0R36_09715, partial [bacterium]|nr:hypothetical protein [bacterium]
MLSIIDRYKKYGIHLNQFRALPDINDGLRPVERRALLGGYKEAKDKMVKSVKIVAAGLVLHPHGDVSFYNTLTKMVNSGFFDKQGNWGSSNKLEPQPAAAMRYTEARLNNYYKEMIFEFINNVDWHTIEIEEEPVYLPTPIPLCFLIDSMNIGIGFGIRSVIPRYTINDLISLTKSIVVDKKHIIIKPYCPGNIVIMEESECEKLLNTGKGKITYRPRYKIDHKSRSIKILGCPATGFSSLLKMLQDRYFPERTATALDNSKKNYVEIEIYVNKNKKCDFDELIKDVMNEITKTINYEILLNDNGKMKLVSVKELLIKNLNNYMKAFYNKLEEENNRLKNKLYEFTVIENIRPYLGNYLKNKMYNVEFIVKDLIDNIPDLKEDILKNLLKQYSIEKIFTASIDANKI